MAKFRNKIMLSLNKHVFDKFSKLTPVLSKQYLITYTNERLQQFWQFWMYVKNRSYRFFAVKKLVIYYKRVSKVIDLFQF